DYARFYQLVRRSSPETLILAPGSAELGEPMRTLARWLSGMKTFDPVELLTSESPPPDVVSFHYYGASSQRCKLPLIGSKPADAFDAGKIAGIDDGIRRTAELRDRIVPGAPLWNTESGETACGGNPWASTFADTLLPRPIGTLRAAGGTSVFSQYACQNPSLTRWTAGA
ncbi:MAG: hypothetical protein OEV88_18365, partial [Gammaproteobacteria bacterium]|nr:hypothetical protein [Gammaproteobacteria bacterium]